MGIRVHSRQDVVVVGGGTAGTMAAIAAARQGARVLLIEKGTCLGGTASAGLMSIFITFHSSNGELVLRGIPLELVDRMIELGGSPGHVLEQQGLMYSCVPFDVEILKHAALELTQASGAKVLFDTWLSDVLVEDDVVRGVVIENKSGRQIVLAENVVDTTGDADVVARAGAQFMKGEPSSLQPLTLMCRIGNVNVRELIDFMVANPSQFKLSVEPEKLRNLPFILNCLEFFAPWQEAVRSGRLPKEVAIEQAWFSTSGLGLDIGEVTVNMTRIPGADATDGDQLSSAISNALMQVRPILLFLRESLPGFAKAYLMQTAPLMGVRETRRIVGQYTLTKEDIMMGRKFEDAVARSACPIDIHESDGQARYIWIKSDKQGSIPYEIPYRCLIPVKMGNLIVGGRCISSTREAFGSVRLMGTCLATGQAAGLAVGLATKKGIPPRLVNIGELQEVMRQVEEESLASTKLATHVNVG